MAVETFGVDQAHVESYLPQLLISAASKLTPARMAEIIEGAAARVGAVIEAAFGAGTVVEIALDSAGLEYRNCQLLTVRQAGPDLLAAQHGHTAVDGYQDMLELARDEMAGLQRNPAATIGRVSDKTSFPSVSHSTARMGLDTSVGALREARVHDGRNRRSGRDQGGYIW